MKVALVHDDFVQAGGAESLFAAIASLWPEAPIYTALVDWSKLPQTINRDRVKTSFLQRIPYAAKFFKALLPFYPFVFESFDLGRYEVVISSTTRFAKSAVTKPSTTHICYINSTPRFLWDEKVKKEYLPQPLLFLASPILSWLKRWDRVAASRADFYIANSKNVATRVKKYYGRESTVIYPFANISFYSPAKVHNWQLKGQNYYLVVSRLVKWKKIDLAIKACASMDKNLIIVGDGPDRGRLEKIAEKSRTQFLGKVTPVELRQLYQNSEALIVTQEEDFGIAAVEAQACGIPVIAFAAGGSQEIIIDGKTGILFKNQKEIDLKDAILAADKVKWKGSACRKNSLRFSQAVFVKELKQAIYARS